LLIVYVIYFFQAEDGIRDRNVTGVQTCALPIYPAPETDISAANNSSAKEPTTDNLNQDSGTPKTLAKENRAITIAKLGIIVKIIDDFTIFLSFAFSIPSSIARLHDFTKKTVANAKTIVRPIITAIYNTTPFNSSETLMSLLLSLFEYDYFLTYSYNLQKRTSLFRLYIRVNVFRYRTDIFPTCFDMQFFSCFVRYV